MKSISEMKKQVEEMPANQWFSMDEINGGVHSPDLWKHLCNMDHHGRVRGDGARLVSKNTRLDFMWKR